MERYFHEKAEALKIFPVWLLLGPRQVGKSSLLRRLGPERTLVDLDDLTTRTRAHENPEFFFKNLKPPLFIDEIQYAPALLSPIKRLADARKEPGMVWVTGSQNFQVMSGIKETLAGRVAILHLLGFSDEEKNLKISTPLEYFDQMLASTFPALFQSPTSSRSVFFSSYAQTYLERDVRELLQVERRREFEIFLKMCALRTASVVNLESLARDTGVDQATIKRWLGVLEDSFIIRLVHPWFSNRNKRLIKSPKIYFLDAGLAAYLAGWNQAESALHGPFGGALFETHVFGNLVRAGKHRFEDWTIHFWRTRDGQEVDFLVTTSHETFAVEVKLGLPRARDLLALEKLREKAITKGWVISLQATAEPMALSPDWQAIHPAQIHHFLSI